MNNREVATLIWLGGFLLWGATKADIRAAYWGVVKAFVQTGVVVPLALLAAWTAGVVAAASQLGLWKSDVLSDTIVWFVTVGVALFFSLNSVGEDGFFRRTAKRAVGVTVFVEVFVNLAVLPLPAELLLVPVATFVAVMVAFTEGKDEFRAAHRLANGLLSIVGFGFMIYVAVRLLGEFDAGQTGRKLALPVWLTLGVMPLVYGVGLVSAYRQAFVRIGLSTDDPVSRRRAKRALLWMGKFRASDVAAFGGHWIVDLTSAESAEHAREVMGRYRAAWRSEQRSMRTADARDFMEEWLTHSNATLGEVHRDALQRSWKGLDHEQRAALKAEAPRVRGARRERVQELLALPD